MIASFAMLAQRANWIQDKLNKAEAALVTSNAEMLKLKKELNESRRLLREAQRDGARKNNE